eukprot:SAG22_NODE_710_length_7741_cov_108.460089_3_plen_78_part_00
MPRYKGGFQDAMDRREAALILGIRDSAEKVRGGAAMRGRQAAGNCRGKAAAPCSVSVPSGFVPVEPQGKAEKQKERQ